MMDRNGIGTDATIADHIKTIHNREYANTQSHTLDHSAHLPPVASCRYVERTRDRRIKPTTLGYALVVAYMQQDLALYKPFLRAQMERDLTEICAGTKTRDQVVAETIAIVWLLVAVFERWVSCSFLTCMCPLACCRCVKCLQRRSAVPQQWSVSLQRHFVMLPADTVLVEVEVVEVAVLLTPLVPKWSPTTLFAVACAARTCSSLYVAPQ